MEIQEYDLDILEIAKKVFSGPIRDPFMYQIQFDPDERTPGTSLSLYIFEQLLILFTEGLKVYFNQPQIAIENISPQDFYNMQQHFKSLGFILNCQTIPLLNESKISEILSSIDPDELPPLSSSSPTSNFTVHSSGHNSIIASTGDDLKDYSFTTTKGNLRYVISFDILSQSNTCKTV